MVIIKTPPKPNLRADLIAAFVEFIGMAVFIFLAFSGTQSALESPIDLPKGPTSSQIVQVAFSFGVGITVGLFICAPISGGALNPAVVLGLFMTGAMSWLRAILIFLAEIVGAILGAYFSNFVTANKLQATNILADNFNYAQGFFAEMLLTMILVLVVLFVIVDGQFLASYAPFVVGTTIFILHVCGVPIDGTSVNPARSFGAAVVTGIWTNHWIFWFGPLIGGFFAGLIFYTVKYITPEPEQIDEEKNAFYGAETQATTQAPVTTQRVGVA
ncbi:unnamed protein product [Cunninghamella blakesleeana]